MPGFRNAHLYPLRRSDQGRRLARGSTRDGKAVIYVLDSRPARSRGHDPEESRPDRDRGRRQDAVWPAIPRVGTRGEPFDILFGWGADYIDPVNFLSMLDGRTIRDRENNNSVLRLQIQPRARKSQSARGRRAPPRARRARHPGLENEAPIVPLYHPNNHQFVSERVGCIVLNNYAGGLNLGACA